MPFLFLLVLSVFSVDLLESPSFPLDSGCLLFAFTSTWAASNSSVDAGVTAEVVEGVTDDCSVAVSAMFHVLNLVKSKRLFEENVDSLLKRVEREGVREGKGGEKERGI
jgi:hypothetical protein